MTTWGNVIMPVSSDELGAALGVLGEVDLLVRRSPRLASRALAVRQKPQGSVVYTVTRLITSLSIVAA